MSELRSLDRSWHRTRQPGADPVRAAGPGPGRLPWCAVLAALGLGLVIGCGGGAGTPPLRSAYPPERYLVAEGSSPGSQAEAEARARAAIAAQIRASLVSRTTSASESVWQDGVERHTAAMSQQLEQEAAFSRAELIRIDPRSLVQRDGVFHAVAYLPREEAARALRQDLQRLTAEFQRRAVAADAVPGDDLPGFAAAYGEARESWLALQRSARELRAVSGSQTPGLDGEVGRWDALQARRQERFAAIRVALALQPPRPARDRLDEQYLRQALTMALQDLGLTVRGDSCSDAAYLLDLQPRLDYRGVVGVVCRLELAGQLRECATGDAWDLHLTDPAWSGEGANAHAARNEAAAGVTPGTLTPHLLTALAACLPVR